MKTPKAKQDGFVQTTLPHMDVTLIDGGLLIHSFLSATSNIMSYGQLARNLLTRVSCSYGNEIHVLFDTYVPSSIKEGERRLRGAEDRPFVLSGPEQAPKQSCNTLLQNGSFKDQLAGFIVNEWQKNHYGPIIEQKTLVSHGGKCFGYTFNELENKMNVECPRHLHGVHEEADTLLAFHAAHVMGNIMVRASETDVLVILLGMLGRQMESGKSLSAIIMDCGSGNNRRYIDVRSIATGLEAKQPGIAASLPGLHAFTGCDYTAAFYRKGKIKPLDILQNDTDGKFIQFFKRMTSTDEPDYNTAGEFVCAMYGYKNMDDINEARHTKLLHMTGTINWENPLANIKKIDCALLPPCKKTLCLKTQRAHFVSLLWGRADSSHPSEGLEPDKYGWRKEGGYYVPNWFEGPALPLELFGNDADVAHSIPEESDEDDVNSESPWSGDSENDGEF